MPIIPIDPVDIDPDDEPPYDSLPGLGQFNRKRSTSNLIVSEEIPAMDLLDDVICVAARMFFSQGANGKIRFHNKKPVDFALGYTAFTAASNLLSVDNISAWVADQKYFVLIDPHTTVSEIRVITEANYPTAQNSTTLTTSHTGTAFTVAGFAGANGTSIPATATITVNSFVADTTYTVTLDGTAIAFIPRASDTTQSIANFIAGAFSGHPRVNRRFTVTSASGTSVVNLTARFGILKIDNALAYAHAAPITDPVTAPTLAETASGTLLAGAYRVAYAFKNEHGQTMLSPYKEITIAASKKITVSAITPPGGSTVVWYTVPEADSTKLRYHSENNGASFIITALPKLSAPLPPDLNRTGTEIMRVKAVFSDRAETRSGTEQSNVIRASFGWFLKNRKDTKNQVELTYRDASQDYRLVTLKLRDDEHIAKVHKILSEKIVGTAIDNSFQAYRIASSALAEKIDANFDYEWTATRQALLLEEFDVVVCTDSGSGVVNLPVSIEKMELDMSGSGMPKASFSGNIFANTLYDDSIVERRISVVTG